MKKVQRTCSPVFDHLSHVWLGHVAQWMTGGFDGFNATMRWFIEGDAERIAHHFVPTYIPTWGSCGGAQWDDHFKAWDSSGNDYDSWTLVQYLSEKHGDDFVGRMFSSCSASNH